MAPTLESEQTQQSYDGMRQRGKTTQFLANKGFGWLLEVDDEDEDSQTPLL